jgi:P27 family predicted phage terminase small subunit
MSNLKMPTYIRADKRAAQVFREVQKYLKEFGSIEKVDSDAVGCYSIAVSEFETLSEYLAKNSHVHIDSKGAVRRRPETFIRKDASESITRYAKLLGIDRGFREKGRGEQVAKGRRPVDKIGKLRKVG